MGYAEDQHWTQRELSELRAREARYRDELAARNALRERLRASLRELDVRLRASPPTQQGLLSTLGQVAVHSARALKVSRASVWRYDASAKRLSCAVMVVDGMELTACDFAADLTGPETHAYVRALSAEGVLAAADAMRDPRTIELLQYLRAYDVQAMLDIPVLSGGELAGVICHEQVGSTRSWEPEEEDFALHLGSLVTLALEAALRVHAEYAAQGAEAKYRSLVESLPVTVYSFEPRQRRLEYVSPQIAQWDAQGAQGWLARGVEGWLARICDEDRPAVLRRMQLGPTCGLPAEIVYRVHVDGQDVRWVRDTTRVLRDERGEPFIMQGVLADITSQRQSELASAEYARRIHFFLEHAALVAVWLDARGRITDVNPHFELVTGRKKEEVLGQDWFAQVTPEAEAQELRVALQEAMRTGRIEPNAEYAIRSKSGEVRTLLWTRAALFDTEGVISGFATIGMDFTERLRLEDQLLQHAKTESLGRLAAGLAHDFNNLLTVIMGQVTLLGAQAHSSAAERAKSALDAALKQAADLTQSMLVYARRQPEPAQRTDVDAVLREVASLATAMVGDDLRFSAHFHADGAHVSIDPTRLRQVFLNLIGNAADATRGVGRSVHAATHLELVAAERARSQGAPDAGTFVVLTISDDGPGMDATTAARIFEPFFSTKRDMRGTGLGMPIVQSIVQRVGGFLEIDTEPGDGATFRVFLPVAEEASERVPLAKTGSTAMDSKEPKAVLLVLQDSALKQVAPVLRSAGYQVLVAHGIHSAAHHVAVQAVDFLVVEAAGEEGPERVLARSARAVRPRLRAVLVSAHTSAEALATGFDRVLTTPVDGQQLLQVLEDLQTRRDPSS